MSIRERLADQVAKTEGYGPKGLKERSLRDIILSREELPVLRVEQRLVHGQLVEVRVLPPGNAFGHVWWQQECSHKKYHLANGTDCPTLAQMRW